MKSITEKISNLKYGRLQRLAGRFIVKVRDPRSDAIYKEHIFHSSILEKIYK